MKQMIITAVVIVLLGIAALAYFKADSPARKAAAAESKGDYLNAAAFYVEAFFENVDGMALPDKNRARVLTADKWNNDVRQYLGWIMASTAVHPSQSARKLLEKLRSVCGRVPQVHYEQGDSVFAYQQEWMLAEDWDRAFFPSNTTLIKNQSALVREALNAGISILRIRALTSYSFEASLVDLNTWKRTDFTLAPEDEVSLLVRPHGEYLLICSSTVEFPDGKIWRSPKNLIDLKAPDASSLRTFVLAGKVDR